MSPFASKDYLGEPIIINKGHQLCALLKVCERTLRALDNVGAGPYRDSVESALCNTMELAEDLAADLLSALETVQPREGAKS
ncbi:hypothetical protein ASD50_07530 [Mesorhizobium sp. Root552]|jgi:hypothetical protein|uniref:hypothetical protein n=1 Tax=Mesorhizobium sp. Root552 TaxID=1736555 RepID=UPI0006FC568C|nr:hypothetical protein [Mesorhizobium sp. Root552]KQZ19328.1 hypothetical protein ASD50_07530 [Mesorhizobium sp. Root552]